MLTAKVTELHLHQGILRIIDPEKRRRIHEYLSFPSGGQDRRKQAAAAHTDKSKVRFASRPTGTGANDGRDRLKARVGKLDTASLGFARVCSYISGSTRVR